MSKSEFLRKYQSERQPCLIFTRCMGYYRPTKDFNKGKQSEFNERTFYAVSKNIRGC